MSRGFGGSQTGDEAGGVTSLTVTLPGAGSTGKNKQMGWSRACFVRESRPWLSAGHWRGRKGDASVSTVGDRRTVGTRQDDGCDLAGEGEEGVEGEKRRRWHLGASWVVAFQTS